MLASPDSLRGQASNAPQQDEANEHDQQFRKPNPAELNVWGHRPESTESSRNSFHFPFHTAYFLATFFRK
jgi:hypothetical protein